MQQKNSDYITIVKTVGEDMPMQAIMDLIKILGEDIWGMPE
jgi:hypothetical protein